MADLKASLCGELPNQESVIPKEQLRNLLARRGIVGDPDKPNHSDILYRLDISERHYYRLRQQAVNILSIRLWTAPVGCLDAWLELLTLLEG